MKFVTPVGRDLVRARQSHEKLIGLNNMCDESLVKLPWHGGQRMVGV